MNFAINCRTNFILRQDIEDFVKCRNTLYGHAKEAKLTDSNYTKYKTDVEGIILRIARFCNIENEMRQKLNDAAQRPLDEAILLQYQNTLIEQGSYEKKIEEKVDELLQQSILKDKRLHCRMDTIEGKVGEIAQTEARLSEHSKDDTYVQTEDVELCRDILNKYKTLVIIAKTGGGKTKTSLQIASLYQKQNYTPMLFVNDEILRNRDLINFDDQNMVMVEDLFGKLNIAFNETHIGILDILNSCIRTVNLSIKIHNNNTRPGGWKENDTNFVEIETDSLLNKLYFNIHTNRHSKENFKIGVTYFINYFDNEGRRYLLVVTCLKIS
ncbi:unnamed protein product [Mytilus edulis]|uniref:Novel STAND NTPase 3 domain-containing protein n=1 Tax=Mytilus edulis TaxID=6550 RepID=A0A8S3SI17_MYTED|nr:unnamed protein product [Mytilus edulis]